MEQMRVELVWSGIGREPEPDSENKVAQEI